MNVEKKEVMIKLSHFEKSDVELARMERVVTSSSLVEILSEHDVVKMSKFFLYHVKITYG